MVYVSVSLSASSAAVRGTPPLPAPFPLTREIPSGRRGELRKGTTAASGRLWRIPAPPAHPTPQLQLPGGPGPPHHTPTPPLRFPPLRARRAQSGLLGCGDGGGGRARAKISRGSCPIRNKPGVPDPCPLPGLAGFWAEADFTRTSQSQPSSPDPALFPSREDASRECRSACGSEPQPGGPAAQAGRVPRRGLPAAGRVGCGPARLRPEVSHAKVHLLPRE